MLFAQIQCRLLLVSNAHGGGNKVNKFKVGDRVYLLEGARGSVYSQLYSPEKLDEFLTQNSLSREDHLIVMKEGDSDGDVLVKFDGSHLHIYLQEQFLSSRAPKQPELVEVDVPDLAKKIYESLAEVDIELQPSAEPGIVEVDKLLEANEFLGHIEPYFLLELVTLAKRLK